MFGLTDPNLSIAHKNACKRGILHRDISADNGMMYEETLEDGSVRVRGLLIDFDYAIRIDELGREPAPGDRTVSTDDEVLFSPHDAHTGYTSLYGY